MTTPEMRIPALSADSVWSEAKSTLEVGSIVKGVVVAHFHFGVFLKLDGSAIGLIQIPYFKEKGERMTPLEYPKLENPSVPAFRRPLLESWVLLFVAKKFPSLLMAESSPSIVPTRWCLSYWIGPVSIIHWFWETRYCLGIPCLRNLICWSTAGIEGLCRRTRVRR